jgi:glutathione S-transferase
MKLYYTPGACSLAPHIALREIGASFDLEKVDLRARKTESGANFLDVNPKGYVPALALDDGEILTEGVVMQQYLADLKPDSKLAPARGSRERLRLDELMVFLSTEVHKSFSPLFGPTTPDEYRATAKDKISQRLAFLDAQLSDGRPFLTGENFTIADGYLFTLSNWTRPVGLDLAQWKNLAAFAGRVSQRPAAQAALKAEGLV